jgi:glutamate-1-semialdehyde 2,1-aminomutase
LTNQSRSADAALRARAARVVPGGVYGHVSAALMSAGTPQFFARAKGARVWDADGREYIDYSCAYGPNLLGYGDPRVEAAAERQGRLGDTMTGPSPVYVELAEMFVSMVTHADWVMFAKNGTDVTTAALTVARAHTGRRRVLVAAGSYHGTAPWCSPVTTGILADDRAHRRTYTYNDVESLERAVAEAGSDLAAIFVTPFKHDVFTDQELPRPEYARRCRALCDKTGALLVVDDIRGGFRLARDCSWSLVDVQPDLSCWSKAIANGYPISALLGAEKFRDAASHIFFTGSFWFSAVPMAAALATLEIVANTRYLEHTVALGNALREGLHERAVAHGLGLSQTGPVQMPLILFEGDPDLRLGVAFCGAMIQRGIYFHPWHNMFLCSAMTESDIERTLAAADDAFAEIARIRMTLRPHEGIAALMASMSAAS